MNSSMKTVPMRLIRVFSACTRSIMKVSTGEMFSPNAPKPCFQETWAIEFCARAGLLIVGLLVSAALVGMARASDHLDSPATVANPQADIGDVYAWTASEGGSAESCHDDSRSFVLRIRFEYTLHVDSGARVWSYDSASTTIECRFDSLRAAVKCTARRASIPYPEIRPSWRESRAEITIVSRVCRSARRSVLQQCEGASRRV